MHAARRLATTPRLAGARRMGAAALRMLPIERWARLHTGDRLRVLMSSTVGRSVWLRGVYEPEVEAVLVASLRVGDTFFDVGADCGFFTAIAARLVGPEGQVYAFEPRAGSRRRIERTVAANGFEQVTVVGAAVWCESTVLALGPARDPAFGYVETVGQDAHGPTPNVSVDAITLDRYASAMWAPSVRVVKIDVEGAELAVLRGARALLARACPILIVEAQDWSLARFGASIDDLFEFAGESGYSAETLTGDVLDSASAARAALSGATVSNLVFRPTVSGPSGADPTSG